MSGSSGGSAGDSAAEAANFEDYESDAYNVTAGSTGHPTMTGDSNQVDWSPSDDTADTAGGYEDQGGPASRTDVSSIHGESDDPDSVSCDPSIAAAQEREAEHLATGDADALVVDTYGPQVDIETIHGETDDAGSVSFDPTYNVETQEQATKEAAFGTGKGAGDKVWNPETGTFDRVTNYTFKEHWDRAPDSLKFSPTLRFFWATAKNAAEFLGSGTVSEPNMADTQSDSGDNVQNTVPTSQAQFIASGDTQQSNSVAANWYQSLGQNTVSGQGNAFNLATEYAAAKSRVAQRLGTPSAIGWTAVNDSPFYNFLKTNNLDRGIL